MYTVAEIEWQEIFEFDWGVQFYVQLRVRSAKNEFPCFQLHKAAYFALEVLDVSRSTYNARWNGAFPASCERHITV